MFYFCGWLLFVVAALRLEIAGDLSWKMVAQLAHTISIAWAMIPNCVASQHPRFTYPKFHIQMHSESINWNEKRKKNENTWIFLAFCFAVVDHTFPNTLKYTAKWANYEKPTTENYKFNANQFLDFSKVQIYIIKETHRFYFLISLYFCLCWMVFFLFSSGKSETLKCHASFDSFIPLNVIFSLCFENVSHLDSSNHAIEILV